MKIAKRFLLIIAIVILVMASGIQVALGEPTPTAPASTPTSTPTESESSETTDTDTAPVDAETSFTTLKSQSMGENVMRLQLRLRQLGYFNYRATGLYYGMTEKAVKQYQEQNDLSADGQAGRMTFEDMFTVDAIRKPLGTSVIAVSGPGMELDTPVCGELSTWDEINAKFTEGMTVTVTDFNTGKTYDVKRTGGVNHADVESVDSANYDKFIDCLGGEGPIWEKRAVLVSIGGVQYAGSIFGNPSGKDSIKENKMDGHTEIYFYSSTSDILGFTDRYHNDKVLTASGAQ